MGLRLEVCIPQFRIKIVGFVLMQQHHLCRNIELCHCAKC